MAGRQIIASVIVNCLAIVAGSGQISPSIILPSLLDGEDNEGLKITMEQGSWIASMSMIGSFIGSLSSGFIIDRFGPRKSLMMDSIMLGLSIVVQSWSYSFYLICFGRFLMGWFVISARISIHPFVAEISVPKQRSITGNSYAVMYTTGMFLVNLFGSFLYWRIACSISLIFVAITFIGLQFLHESPHWLMRNSKDAKAMASFRFYNWNNEEARREYLDHQSSTKHLQIQLEAEEGCRQRKMNRFFSLVRARRFMRKFKEPRLYKPLIFLTVYGCLLELSSFVSIVSYMVIIFQKTGTPINPYYSSTIICALRIIFTLLGTNMMHRFSKRAMFISMGVLATATLTSLGAYCRWKPMASPLYSWIPFILIILLFICFSMGYGTIFLILMGELFPHELKSVGTSIVFLCSLTTSFVIVKLTPLALELLDIHGLFWMFAGFVLITTLHGIIFMPETTNKTLKEIQDYYL